MSAPTEILRVLDDLARLASSGVSVFGSDFHQFRLHPPLATCQLESFELFHGIRLPEEYRAFMLQAGCGGAGPFFGLFQFHHMDDGFEEEPWIAGGHFVGSLSTPFPHAGPWNDLTEEPEELRMDEDEDEYQSRLNAFERKYWRPVDGAIPICHCGCALRQWLVVSGPEAGHVWGDDRAHREGMYPLARKGGERVSFMRWYRDWLDETLQGIK